MIEWAGPELTESGRLAPPGDPQPERLRHPLGRARSASAALSVAGIFSPARLPRQQFPDFGEFRQIGSTLLRHPLRLFDDHVALRKQLPKSSNPSRRDLRLNQID